VVGVEEMLLAVLVFIIKLVVSTLLYSFEELVPVVVVVEVENSIGNLVVVVGMSVVKLLLSRNFIFLRNVYLGWCQLRVG
jgi:hypothetical protein